MLSVSPPLHQDFRSRQMLCSPGDGWRAYKPPPPLVLPNAFHFLAPLLLPEAYPVYSDRSTVTKPIQIRHAMDKRFYGKLEKVLQLPIEILEEILGLCINQGYGKDLILVSKQFSLLTIPIFYQSITVTSKENILNLIQTLKVKTELIQCIRELNFNLHRLPWEEVKELMDLINPQNKIKTLSIQIPASDLHMAINIFQSTTTTSSILPSKFIWKTSPCWQLFPLRNQFIQFFENWKLNLNECVLENFHFDQTLIEFIKILPNLNKLSLRGRGSEHISKEIILDLLSSCQKDSHENDWNSNNQIQKEFLIEIANCSITKQALLEQVIHPSSLHRLSWI